jgi:threonine 3-dehydrogenase
LACLQEPLGNAVHAALAEDITGQSVLITGCGPTGLFATAVARTAGAGLLIATDTSDYRLALAKQLGADHVLKAGPDEATVIERLTHGQGVDVALEMSGNPTAIHTAFRFVKNGGRVTLFGIPEAPVSFDMTNEIIFKGIRVYGITGRKLFQTWYRLTGLFQAGLNITPVVTHTLPMARFAEGFDLIAKGQCGKIVLLP